MKTLIVCLLLAFHGKGQLPVPLASHGKGQLPVPLASHGKARVRVVLPADASVTQVFAAAELTKYLNRISGAVFPVVKAGTARTGAIFIRVNGQMGKEDYRIAVEDGSIILAGGSGRAVLYAVYDLLHRLGCLWLSPDFSFYNGSAEYIPKRTELSYAHGKDITEHPRFRYRKLDVEEGQSHTVENLKELIDWMPKLRFNTLQVPLNYGGWGRVRWDNWREALTPELKKRGLLIEVGGHGYQNFLNAGMEDSSLFKKHPDWFGLDKNCQPTPNEYSVFNTGNPDAVRYLVGRVEQYVRAHPEIDIFDFWPPDGARWAECPERQALGSPLDRQARLINAVDAAVRKINPVLQLEMIAYQPVLLPPETVALNKDILVDFCPINQSFEKQIYDSPAVNNPAYVRALRQWRATFKGNIGLYSYYRKYGWKSLPNIIPHYMQRDMKWYARIPLQGISSYAEPGDWGSYELNHYVLGHLAWDPDAGVDTLIGRFCRGRYGASWKTAAAVYAALERTVRVAGNIPYTALKPVGQIAVAERELEKLRDEVAGLQRKEADMGPGSAALSRLSLMLAYAIADLQVQEARSAAKAAGEKGTGKNASETRVVEEKVSELVQFLEANRDKGVFILPQRDALAGFMRRYGVGK